MKFNFFLLINALLEWCSYLGFWKVTFPLHEMCWKLRGFEERVSIYYVQKMLKRRENLRIKIDYDLCYKVIHSLYSIGIW